MASVPTGDIVAYAFVSVAALFWCWSAGSLIMVHGYVFGTEALVIRRRILWLIPGGTSRIRYDNIESIEVSHSVWGVYGAPFYREAFLFPFGYEYVVLRLKRRHHHLFSRVILTPEDVGEFVNALFARSSASEYKVATLDRTPVRQRDLWAVLAGLVPVLLIAEAMGLNREAIPPVVGLAAMALLVVTIWFVLVMWSHALASAIRADDPLQWIWVLGIIVIFPLAWAYYLVIWRPRRVEYLARREERKA